MSKHLPTKPLALSVATAAMGLMLSACGPSAPGNRYTVSGTVQDSTLNGQTVYIARPDDRVLLDSAVIRDGQVCFSGTVDTARYCLVMASSTEYAYFILEPGNIVLDFRGHDKPSGTPMNQAMTRVSQRMDSLPILREEARGEVFRKFAEAGRLSEMNDSAYAAMDLVGYRESIALLSRHTDDAVGEYLLHTSMFRDNTTAQQRRLLTLVGPWLRQLNRPRQLFAGFEAEEATAPGRPYRELIGIDPAGRPDSLSRYAAHGGYTLVDIYATWCGPCKQQMPYLADLHRRFGDRGLNVVGICTRDQFDNFRAALDKEDAGYVHIFDTDNRASETYGLRGVPQILLIGPDGTILHRDLRGDAMVQTVTELMQTK